VTDGDTYIGYRQTESTTKIIDSYARRGVNKVVSRHRWKQYPSLHYTLRAGAVDLRENQSRNYMV